MAKILLVEDQDDIRNVLSTALKMQGFEVDAYANGESALEAIESSWPDIAILDSGLPGMSGLDVGQVIDQRTGDRERVVKVALMRRIFANSRGRQVSTCSSASRFRLTISVKN